MRSRSHDRRSNRRSDRGATLVEFALIAPLLIALTIGIMELGMAFRDVLSVSSAVREGTRMLSALGTNPEADCLAIVATAQNLAGVGNLDHLDRIEIYKAEENGEQSPNPAFTNTYRLVGNDLTDCDDWSKSVPWASTSRKTIAGDGYKLDIIGMRIVYRHDWVTGFPPFSGHFIINQTTISRLEPEEFAITP